LIATRLPGSAWFLWLRNLPLRVGVLTGMYLSLVFVVWLIVANRVPFLEDFALLRNWGAMAVFGTVMLVPMGAFLRYPHHLFGSGLAAWLLFSLVYHVMSFFFRNLHNSLRPTFHVFVLGAVVYGLVAVAAWVISMALDARQQPVIASRRRHP